MRTRNAAWLFVWLAACVPSGKRAGPVNPTGPSGPGSMTLAGCPRPLTTPVFTIDQDQADGSFRPKGKCAPGAVDLVNQHITALAGVTLDADGIQDSVAVCVRQGDFALRLKTVRPIDCARDPAPPSSPIHAGFSLSYLGDVRRGADPLCIVQSKVDFDSFTVTGWPTIDNVVQDQVEPLIKDEILQQLDDAVALRLNWVVNHPLDPAPPPVAKSRCDGWNKLP